MPGGWGALRADAGLARELVAAATGAPALPFKLTLALTWRCHHRCAACGIWARAKGLEMNAEQLGRLFGSLPRLRWLDLTGGEVPIRRDLPAISAALRRHCPRLALLHFPTAGWQPEAAVAAARVLRRPGGPRVIVTVSIDGPPALHDELRGVSGAWPRAVRTLRRLRALPGVEVYPGMTLQPANRDAIDATVAALAAELPGFSHRDLHVNLRHRSAHYFANLAPGPPELAPPATRPAASPAELAAVLGAFRRRKGLPRGAVELIEWSYLRLLPAHLRNAGSPLPCRAAEVSAYIAPDGEVFACTIDPRPLGHLRDHGWKLADLWDTAARRALAADARAGRCAGCWTPCEAYPTLLASPFALGTGLVRAALPKRSLP